MSNRKFKSEQMARLYADVHAFDYVFCIGRGQFICSDEFRADCELIWERGQK